MPVTLLDIARAAGVSVTTASRALNHKGEIAPVKRARILDVAHRLGYVPNASARALVSGRTKTLGVVVNNNASPVYALLLRGVEDVANAAGFGLLFSNSADSQEQALDCLAMLRSKNVDGILLTPVQTDDRDVRRLQHLGLPFVLVLRHFPEIATDYVVVDNAAGATLVTRHLLDLGHRRIAHLAGPAHTSTGRERLAGYRQALGERGVPVRDDLVTHQPYTVDGGYAGARQLLGRPGPPTAIVAATDLQAVGVLKAARELGVRVPDDLALAGGDDIELAEFLEVPLTTFRQPARAIGARGAQLLLARLAGDDQPPQAIVFEPTLVVRRSSGCPRSPA